MPAAISGTETVGMPPPSVADVFIQRNFHTIRSLLGYDTSYGIRYINLYHIPLLLQRMLNLSKPVPAVAAKKAKDSEPRSCRVIILPILKHVSPTESESFDSSNSPPDMKKQKRGEVTASTRPSTPRTSFSTASSGTASAYPIAS